MSHGVNSQRPLVKNANDPQQTRRADQLEKLERRRQVDILLSLLELPAFRAYIHRIVTGLRPLEPIQATSPELVTNFVTRHNVAVELLNEINEANPGAWLLIEQEALARSKAREAIASEDNTPKEG